MGTIHQPFDGILTVQKETAFNAASAETIYKWRGILQAGFDVQQGQGQRHTSIFRTEVQNDRFGTWYSGRIEWEMAANEMTQAVFDAFFELKSTAADTPSLGYTTRIYRPRRMGDAGSLKLGIEFQPNGPNYSLGGVIVQRINLRVNLNQFVRISINFIAASKTTFPNTESTTYGGSTIGAQDNFESQYLEGQDLPSSAGMSATAVNAVVGGMGPNEVVTEWDDVVQDVLTAVSADFALDHSPAKFNRSGVVTRFRPGTNFETGFSLTRFTDEDTTIFDDAVDKTQHKLEIDMIESEDATKKVGILWPLTEVRNQNMALIQTDQDPISTITLKGLQEASLDTGDEPLVTLVKIT